MSTIDRTKLSAQLSAAQQAVEEGFFAYLEAYKNSGWDDILLPQAYTGSGFFYDGYYITRLYWQDEPDKTTTYFYDYQDEKGGRTSAYWHCIDCELRTDDMLRLWEHTAAHGIASKRVFSS